MSEEEEGKDDWSLEDSISLEPEEESTNLEKPAESPLLDKEWGSIAGASGDLPLWLSIIGLAIAPLLVVALLMARKQIETTREMGYAPKLKLYLALLVSLLGLGLYFLIIVLLLVKQAGF